LVTGKKTLLRTIRITKELKDLLQRDAKLKRISVNALISSIMTKYAEWDRFRERYATISLSPHGLCAFLESVDDEKIEIISRELGASLTREFILFVFKKINLETYLSYLSLLCRYGDLHILKLKMKAEITQLLYYTLWEISGQTI